MTLPVLRLRDRADSRLRAGHVWIYSNEIDVGQTPLKTVAPGAQVAIETARGKPLGVALANPGTLICARLFSRDPEARMDRSQLVHRLKIALSLRERCFATPHYRLVYGDSDGLPGLVIDRFGDACVVQISVAGMELLKDEIIDALDKVIRPTTLIFKNDGKMREQEGLPSYVDVVRGSADGGIELIENGVKFLAPVLEGQKTGWFYDHRLNRQFLQSQVAGKRVLDVFSYIGGWGIQAAVAGASETTLIDSSDFALECGRRNAALNGVDDRVKTLTGNAFEKMKELCEAGERFDVVVLDPPALIPRRKDQDKGEQAYAQANRLALRLLAKDGLLVSASCSMHLPEARLLDIIRGSARQIDRFVQVYAQGHQGPDHPILPAIPETSYLKAYFVRSLPSF